MDTERCDHDHDRSVVLANVGAQAEAVGQLARASVGKRHDRVRA